VIAPKHIQNKIQEDNNFGHVFRVNSIYLPGWPYPTLKSMNFPIDLGRAIESIIRKGDFDLLHAHGHHFPISWSALNTAQKYGIPSILTLHGMYALNPNVLGGKSLLEDLFNKFVFSKILSKTTSIIGLTDQITKYARRFGRESSKYFTIPNGVNVSTFKENMKRKEEYREKYHIGNEKIVVLFCTRFERVKGVVEFAAAAKELVKSDKIEIILAGGGSLESTVEDMVGNTKGIHLLKWQPKESIHELYIASDIFAMPSRFEGLPLPIIEAMNAGLHIVYTPVGGMPDILNQYSMKTLLNEISPNEIYRILTNVVSNFTNYKDHDSLSYAQKFDWDNIAFKTNEVYSQSVLK